MEFVFCFFFSSRRRHTRSTRDWSSDVCSSDLQRDRRLWVLRDQVRAGLAPPLVETRYDSVAHHEVHAVRGRLDCLIESLKAIRFRHLDAADEVRPDVAFAENVHLVDHTSDPSVPTYAPVFPRVDPFEKPFVPHLHVRVMTIHSRGPVALH